jgi:hypothetical protein
MRECVHALTVKIVSLVSLVDLVSLVCLVIEVIKSLGQYLSSRMKAESTLGH